MRAMRSAGIIPARAGFTPRARRHPGGRADHPRSRGVYETTGALPAATGGSSPLARGLRRPESRGRRRAGIIPARAGFTCARPPSRGSAWDHPRSRGVYVHCGRAVRATSGSSPLARGLPPPFARRIAHAGIIPARAGFTRGPPGPGRVEGDHPRSRGVYPSTTALTVG